MFSLGNELTFGTHTHTQYKPSLH